MPLASAYLDAKLPIYIQLSASVAKPYRVRDLSLPQIEQSTQMGEGNRLACNPSARGLPKELAGEPLAAGVAGSAILGADLLGEVSA